MVYFGGVTMLTSLGQFLRKLRLERGEILKTMADKLGVTSAFQSAVENGKKRMPAAWYEKLASLYSFSEDQSAALEKAVMESNGIVELNIRNASFGKRDLAISFARRFDSLDDETSRQIFALLDKSMED